MCRLLETIRIFDGNICHPEFHLRRMHQSRMECFGIGASLDLDQIIRVPSYAGEGVWRCRILYGKEIESVEFVRYTRRPVHRLKLVIDDELDYHLKYADRSGLGELYGKRGECDDIIIVRNGMLTDTTIANLVFWDGYQWFTPNIPLLPGTQRARLLESGQITETEITLSNYHHFDRVGMINAFNDLQNMQVIPITNIVPQDQE